MTIDPMPMGRPIHKDDVNEHDVMQAFLGTLGPEPTVRSFSVYPMAEAASRRAKDERTRKRKAAEKSRRAHRK